ncbi:diguanylate cyclase [Rugamonas sp.]|uniref:diguanylate cyclase n=1 Tax=Rugamonas sp. TaxID=1926287 RepID=UPI0025D76C8B|nr:diguanylate cyclase [Rugamonas sp.]
MEWSRRILRCAVLHVQPGTDVMNAEAHRLCKFGQWFLADRQIFSALHDERSDRLEREHRQMHNAVRTICEHLLAGRPAAVEDFQLFEDSQRDLIDQLAFFKSLAVSKKSQVDALTGLPMRHCMEKDYDSLSKCVRQRGGVEIAMLVDVDNFKLINDSHGHAGGDVVLQKIACTLKRVLRDNDQVYRYGGEEFVLLMVLPCHIKAENSAAERVLRAIRRLSIKLKDSIVHPTVTIGIAIAGAEDTLGSLIERADGAMYIGKASGRNCYKVAQAQGEQPAAPS